jgi:endonuclease/exonuclease/phosphatase family metal-dependent hydrolase
MANSRPRELVWRALLLTVVSLISSCAPRLSSAPPNATQMKGRTSPSLACRMHPDVSWLSLGDPVHQNTLDQWCSVVGPPAVSMSGPGDQHVTTVVLVSWNMHVGGGRLEELVESIRSASIVPRSQLGIVLLLQEAFRSGSEIPPLPEGSRVPGSLRPRRPTPDVMAVARTLGMSAVYIPSMRNGDTDSPPEREDRGNAVLSTEPLSDIRALELPFGKQRRVAVMATMAPRGADRPLRIVSTHFDTSGDRAAQAARLTTFLGDLGSSSPILVGGDLNSLWGRRDSAFASLRRVLPEEPCGSERTNVWPGRLDIVFGWWRGRLDFIFSTLDANVSRSCQTNPDRHDSDHNPVQLRLTVG